MNGFEYFLLAGACCRGATLKLIFIENGLETKKCAEISNVQKCQSVNDKYTDYNKCIYLTMKKNHHSMILLL